MTDREVLSRIAAGEDSRTQFKDGLPYRGIGSGVGRALQLYNNVDFVNDEDGLFFKTIIRWNRTVNENPSVNLPVNPSVNPSEGENLHVNLHVNTDQTVNQTVNWTVKEDQTVNQTVNWTVNLPEHLEKLLIFLKDHPAATYADMAQHLSKKRAIISVYLNKLKNPPYSLIRRVGSDKTGHWEILKGGVK